MAIEIYWPQKKPTHARALGLNPKNIYIRQKTVERLFIFLYIYISFLAFDFYN